jgi:hypothetical protein
MEAAANLNAEFETTDCTDDASSNAISSQLIFNEGIDTDPGSMRGRWIPNRVTSSAPAIEVGDHLIFKWYTRVRMTWCVLWAPSDTVCAYSGGAICGYCPIELIPVRRPSKHFPVKVKNGVLHGEIGTRTAARAVLPSGFLYSW